MQMSVWREISDVVENWYCVALDEMFYLFIYLF